MNTSPDRSATPSSGKVVFADARAAALLAGQIESLRNPEQGDWERVKHNASRTVYRGTIGDVAVYLKHFHPRTWFHRLARRLGQSDAMHEMRFSRHLHACGVATPPVLAAECDGPCEWLVTRAIAPAIPTDVWHEQQAAAGLEGQRRIRKGAARLGQLISRMHAAGVIHRDLHCGNLLVRTNTDTIRFVLTDLHRTVRRRRLSRRARAINLAQLFHDRRDFTTRSERLRFLRHYLAATGMRGSLRGWSLQVEHFARRHTLRQHAQRDRRAQGRNRYFAPLRLGRGWRGHVVLASKRKLGGSRVAECVLTVDDWRRALSDPEGLTRGADVEIVKDTRSGMVVRRRLWIGAREVDVFIKRPRRKHAWKVLIDCFRPSRPIRAFQLGHALLARRIATALPLASLERRVGPFLTDSILITETVEAPDLHGFLGKWLSDSPAGDVPLSAIGRKQLAQEVLWQLGRMVQQLHDHHFAHRDLKASNIRVPWSLGESPELVLLDLDGLSPVRFMTTRRKFRGLMRLNVSLLQCPVVNHAGRLRMLLGYLRRPGSGRIQYKPFWRVLERWSARKLRQQIRSRRKRQRATRRPT